MMFCPVRLGGAWAALLETLALVGLLPMGCFWGTGASVSFLTALNLLWFDLGTFD